MKKTVATLTLLLLSAQNIKAQKEQFLQQGTVQNLIKEFQKLPTVKQSETKVDQEQANKLFQAAARNDVNYIIKFFTGLTKNHVLAYKYLSAKNEKGQNLVHIATKYRHKDILSLLIKLLALLKNDQFNIQDILNARTKEGKNTALHYAVGAIQGGKNWYFALKLLGAGASLNVKNALNESPLERLRKINAKSAGQLEVLNLITKAANLEDLSIDDETSEDSINELEQRIEQILGHDNLSNDV